VRSPGFLRTAHIRLRSRGPAWVASVRVRTLSNAFIAHAMTWNGSRQSTAFGALAATVVWIHSAPSALTWVNNAARSDPRTVKNFARVSELRPSWAHTIRPVS